jgi:hypothetical protein
VPCAPWEFCNTFTQQADMCTQRGRSQTVGRGSLGPMASALPPIPFIEPDVPIRAHCQILTSALRREYMQFDAVTVHWRAWAGR